MNLRPTSALLAALAIAWAPQAAQSQDQSTTHRACFVPEVGALYLLDLPGLPQQCLSTEHKEISWTDGSTPGVGSVSTTALADGSVTREKVAKDAVGSEQITDQSVGAADLGPNAVTGAKIADGSVTAADLAPGAFGGVSDGSITAQKLAEDAVTRTKIATGAVTGSALATNAVSGDKIVNGAVSTSKLQDLAVTRFKLQDGAVSPSKIQGGAITSDKVARGAIGARQLNIEYERVSASRTIPALGSRTESISCGSKEVLGGGWDAPLGTIVEASFPNGPSSWAVEFANPGVGSARVRIYAVCVDLRFP